jgi:hypothetical protein
MKEQRKPQKLIKMNLRKKSLFVTATIISCGLVLFLTTINSFSLAQAKEPVPILHLAQARQTETSRDFPFPHLNINGQIEPTGTPPPTARVASPRVFVSTFDTTIVKRPFKMKVYDTGTQDGDVVRIVLNGTFVRQVTLTSAGEEIQLNNVRAGVNRIEFVAVSEGSLPPLTLGISYAADQVVEKRTYATSKDLTVGETYTTTVGFPQIALCQYVQRFPCIGPGSHPESAQHVLEAQGLPPEPITAPLLPGRVGNTLRNFYPRLLTVDRDRRNPQGKKFSDIRREDSTRAYQCLDPTIEDRDEYPPAAFIENEASAHIKCINRSDNRGAGSSFGRQLNFYKIREGEPPQPKIEDGDTIEFVVLY